MLLLKNSIITWQVLNLPQPLLYKEGGQGGKPGKEAWEGSLGFDTLIILN